jgi:hypothetical protein
MKVIIALIMSVICSQQAAAAENTALLDALKNCTVTMDELHRLACFDSVMGDLLAEPVAEVEKIVVIGEPAKTVPLFNRFSDFLAANRAECKQFPYLCSARLKSDGPNFFGFAGSSDGKNVKDEAKLEFNISLKQEVLSDYFRKRQAEAEAKPGGKGWSVLPDRMLFIYNGKYDFYAFESSRYESKPVISRLQNPGLSVEWDFPAVSSQDSATHRLRLGVFHESNGQTLNNDDDDDGDRVLDGKKDFEEVMNSRGSKGLSLGREAALAEVSRTWWYWKARYEYSSKKTENFSLGWHRAQLDLRYFFNKDDDIFWDPANRQAGIENFDGVRVMGEIVPGKISENLLLRAELQTGIGEPFKRVGGRVSIGWGLGGGAFFSAYYFNGYGKDPSTYHLRMKHAGIGLDLR